MSTAHLLLNPQSRLIANGDSVPPSYATSWNAVVEPTSRTAVQREIPTDATRFVLSSAKGEWPASELTVEPTPATPITRATGGSEWLGGDTEALLGFEAAALASGDNINAFAEYMPNSYQTKVGNKVFQMGRVVPRREQIMNARMVGSVYIGGPRVLVEYVKTSQMWYQGLVVSIKETANPNNGLAFLTTRIEKRPESESTAPDYGPNQYYVYLQNLSTGGFPNAPMTATGQQIFYATPYGFIPSLYDPATNTTIFAEDANTQQINYEDLRGPFFYNEDIYPGITVRDLTATGLPDGKGLERPLMAYGPQTIADDDGRIWFLPMGSDHLAYCSEETNFEIVLSPNNWWQQINDKAKNPEYAAVLGYQPCPGVVSDAVWSQGITDIEFQLDAETYDGRAAWLSFMYAEQFHVRLNWVVDGQDTTYISIVDGADLFPETYTVKAKLRFYTGTGGYDGLVPSFGGTQPVKGGDIPFKIEGAYNVGFWVRRLKFQGGCLLTNNRLLLTPLFGWLNPWFCSRQINAEISASERRDDELSLVKRFMTIYHIEEDRFEFVKDGDAAFFLQRNVIYYSPIQVGSGLVVMQSSVLTDPVYDLSAGFAQFNPDSSSRGGLKPFELDRSAPYTLLAPPRSVSQTFGLLLPLQGVALTEDGLVVWAPYMSEADILTWTILDPDTLDADQFQMTSDPIWAGQEVGLLGVEIYEGNIAITGARPIPTGDDDTYIIIQPSYIASLQVQIALDRKKENASDQDSMNKFEVELGDPSYGLSAYPLLVIGNCAVAGGVFLPESGLLPFPGFSINTCLIKLTNKEVPATVIQVFGESKGRAQKVSGKILPRFVKSNITGQTFLSRTNISSSASFSRPSDLIRCSRIENENFRIPTATDKSIFPCENSYFLPDTQNDTPDEASLEISEAKRTNFTVTGDRYRAVAPSTFNVYTGSGRKVPLAGSNPLRPAFGISNSPSQVPIGPFGVTQPGASRIFSSTVLANRTFLYATPTNTEGSKKLTMSEIRRGLPGFGSAVGTVDPAGTNPY